MSEIDQMRGYAAKTIAEAEGLLRLLEVVDEAQWASSPAASVEREAKVANTSGAVDDPTGVIVTDPSRLAIREQVVRSERLLRHALVNVAGVRRGLEIRLHQWEMPRNVSD